MADLGDLGAFLKEGSIPNLDWLEVDPTEYRAQDTLPKQNLDVVPDLEALWTHEDKPATAYVENQGSLPHTMGDMSQEHGHLRAKPEEIRKVARLALMQSPTDLGRLRDTLVKRFDRDSLREARGVLASVLEERGLLGRLYIEASDFNGCDRGSSQPVEFARRFAGEARYVIAKTACGNCVHAMTNPTGGQTCSVFHKEIQIAVPYTEALAAEINQLQRSKGKAVTAVVSGSVVPLKKQIANALLAKDAGLDAPAALPKPIDNVVRLMRPVEAHADYEKPAKKAAHDAIGYALATGRISVLDAQNAYRAVSGATDLSVVRQIHEKVSGQKAPAHIYAPVGQRGIQQVAPEVVEQQLIAASSLSRKRDEEAKRLVAGDRRMTAQQERNALPLVALLRREMLKGRGKTELVSILKHASTSTDLKEMFPHLMPLLKEAGLYGVVYSTQASFDDCREGSDFFATYNPSVRGIVAGDKCGSCIYNKMARCLMYGKPLVKDAADLYTQETVDKVALEYRASGVDVSLAFTETSQGHRAVLSSLHETACTQIVQNQTSPVARMAQSLGHAHTMNRSGEGASTSSLTRREIVKTARRFLNEGLYGSDLLTSLKSRFDVRDLTASAEELRPVMAEQGLMGIHYVDPTVYEDYGKGCKEAASLHRSRLVPYLKQGSKCGSCVHQSRLGFCSVVNKPLVEEPPYVNKAAQQREVLASGKSTEVSYESLMNNGLTMMAEYQLQNGGFEVEVDPEPLVASLGVEFGNAGQGIKL